MRYVDSKRSNDILNVEPNGFKDIVLKFLWEVIYAYFYNWDGSHYLVLVVYALIELIIKASHWTKDYLIFYIHTQHTSMFNKCHIHLCDCTWLNVFSHAQSLLIKHKKIIEYFSCFWKVFCFCKNVKNFKNNVALFWQLSRELVQSYVLVASSHEDF